MAYYFRRDSEVHIQWTLYYPMRPLERICNSCEATDDGRSHDNMTNVVNSYYTIENMFFNRNKVSTY